MSKQAEKQVRAAWDDLLHLAEGVARGALRDMREAEQAEAREARRASIGYPVAERLAGLCETALQEWSIADLYRVRAGHRIVAIVAAMMMDDCPERLRAWRARHGEAIRAFRAAALAAK